MAPLPRVVPTSLWALAVGAMLSAQLGSALSVGLMATAGPAGAAWLRLSFAAVVFTVLARPPLRRVRRRDLPALIGLGATTGLAPVCFLAAIHRIPLGTAVAIEFLGPLVVAGIQRRRARALVWPLVALVGVLLLTEPWQGVIDPVGVGFAALAAVGWAVYVVLMQRLGDRFPGTGALSITVPVAAVAAGVVGLPQAVGHIGVLDLLAAAGLAVLLPVLPFALEMRAMRGMARSAFGTLMALEPAMGVALGLLVLRQFPAPGQVLGVLLVVAAGAAAQRGGLRELAPVVAAPARSAPTGSPGRPRSITARSMLPVRPMLGREDRSGPRCVRCGFAAHPGTALGWGICWACDSCSSTSATPPAPSRLAHR